jgi:hypothetical protein
MKQDQIYIIIGALVGLFAWLIYHLTKYEPYQDENSEFSSINVYGL